MAFKRAQKFDSKLRLALAGPAGSGKTYTALILATALANGGSVAVIDTERGSASKYADRFSFDVMELDSFHPDKFVQGIHEAEQAGYAVLIIDSLSHAWNGTGGLLEVVEQITKRSQNKNSFTAWSEATPIQNRLVDAITRCKIHVIATMRAKQEYVIEQINGKATPRKVGMAPIQRDGVEFEFDIMADLDYENTLIVQKSRCPALSGAVISKPDARVAETLRAWLDGEAAPVPVIVETVPSNNHAQEQEPPASEQQKASLRKLCQHLGRPEPENLVQLTYQGARDLIVQLSQEYNEARKETRPAGKPSTPDQARWIGQAARQLGREVAVPATYEEAKLLIHDLQNELQRAKDNRPLSDKERAELLAAFAATYSVKSDVEKRFGMWLGGIFQGAVALGELTAQHRESLLAIMDEHQQKQQPAAKEVA